MTNQFWRDSTRMVFEEVEPGRLRGVTAWDGSRYIQEQTISKKYLETLRGPLVEVPDPWMATLDGGQVDDRYGPALAKKGLAKDEMFHHSLTELGYQVADEIFDEDGNLR